MNPAPSFHHLSPKATVMRFRLVLFSLIIVLLSSCAHSPQQRPPAQPPAAQKKGEGLYLEAEKYYRSHDYRRAWQTYAAYLQQNPQGDRANQARLREAELLGLLGDWQGSLNTYKDLLNRGVGGTAALQARYGIGRAYFKLGRYQMATEVLESLTASELPEPLRFSTNALLAEIALKKGAMEHAFSRLRLAARDLPAGDQEWFDYLKTRLVEQATPAELESLVNLYRDSSLTAPMLLRLARLAQEGGRSEEADKWLQTLKQRFPESKEAKASENLLARARPIVGCLLPLSGGYAEYGNRLKTGMELAAQETHLELVYRDCPNPAQAAHMVQELSQDSHVVSLLGPLTSADAQAAAEAAQAASIPLIGLTQKQDLTAAGSEIFQAFLTPQMQVKSLLQYTLGERGLHRYAMLTPDSAYGRAMAKVFEDELVGQGGTLVAQATYPPNTQDFTQALGPLLTAWQSGTAGNPAFEALFIPDEARTLAAIADQVAKQPFAKVQLLGSNLAHPKKGQTGLDQALNGILFPDAFFASDPNPAVQKFIAAYRQRYGNDPDYLAAQGYMVVRLMAHVLAGQTPPTRAELPQKLIALRDVPDLPWFKGFSADRQAELALYVLIIKDGQMQIATTPAAVQP
jgi:branched-chain amino acid transport system substrate-binding protein